MNITKLYEIIFALMLFVNFGIGSYFVYNPFVGQRREKDTTTKKWKILEQGERVPYAPIIGAMLLIVNIVLLRSMIAR